MKLLRRRNISRSARIWWLETWSNIVGTIIGIVLTFGVGFWIDEAARKKDQKVAVMMVVTNMLQYARTIENNYKFSASMLPYLRNVVEMTPQDVKELPTDSIELYLYSFVANPISHNDFPRTLLNSDMSVLRSTDDYKMLIFLDYYYEYLNKFENNYNELGPVHLLNEINSILEKKAIEQNLEEETTEWNLLTIVESKNIKRLISNYISNFAYSYEQFDQQMKEFKENLKKETHITGSDLMEFFQMEDEEDIEISGN